MALGLLTIQQNGTKINLIPVTPISRKGVGVIRHFYRARTSDVAQGGRIFGW